ncbi:MAG: caspase family protein [Planctomycetes bacterium]|nr:caspase family protein [Planctomycetota bacterium]
MGSLAAGATALAAASWGLVARGGGATAAAAAAQAAVAPVAAGTGQTPAALALLVGIDVYAPSGRGDDLAPLDGPRNDVARARALLQERFGFAADQIVELLGPQATHQAIVQRFHEHLIARAEPQTKVVFWFSGHGSHVPDASGRDGSAGVDAAIASDQTLVAYDSRAVDPDGGYDLTDDQLYSLLAALRAEDVLVVTDCCHSGGVLRGGPRALGVRECRAGTVPLARERLAAFWPADVPLLDDDQHGDLPAVVQIAACSAAEEAGELVLSDGTFGTLTWFLTKALGEVDPRAAWGEVTAQVRANVAGLGTRPGQRVAMVGDERRAVFGGTGRPVPKGFLVDRDGVRDFRIAAGSLFGITEGAEFTLLALDGTDVGTARAERVWTGHCKATWTGSGEVPRVALRAEPKALGTGQLRLRVALEGIDAARLDDCPWVVVTPPPEAEYVLRPDGGRLGLFDHHGHRVQETADDRAALRDAFSVEHRFRTLWEGVAAPGRHRLDLAIEPVDAAEAQQRKLPPARLSRGGARGAGARPGAVAAAGAYEGRDRGGGLAWLRVVNRSSEDLFVAVLSATETREVNVLIGRSADNLLRAGQERRKLILLGRDPQWPADLPLVDRYVAIATPRYVNFAPFESKAAVGLVRGGDYEAMPPFLRQALGGTRTRGDMDRPAWGIATFDVQVVTDRAFDEARAALGL